MRDKSNIKTIKELHEYTFYIPDYQRNYRWTKDEVQQLIDDIYNSDEGYSLQPIVVKKKEDKKYELIDGQQRLTTLYIIFMIFEIEYNKDVEYYKIKRDNNCNCLSKKIDEIRKLSTNEIDKLEDIDEWHIAHAYNTIKKYIEKEKLKNKKFLELCKNTQVIWYEIDENEDPIIVFERLNVGKIPLEKAEIIKAEAITELEEQDRKACAKLWYETEIDLRKEDDIKYCTLSNKVNELTDGTQRISVYLDIIEKQKGEGSYYEKLLECSGRYKHLMETMFNLTGYYISSIGSAEYNLQQNDIINRIKEYIDNLGGINNIVNLDYNDDKTDVQNILLLYNVLLYNKNNAIFPYNKYKKEEYNIEHINAQKLEYEKLFEKSGKSAQTDIKKTVNSIIEKLQKCNVDINKIKSIKEEKIYENDAIAKMTNNISNLTLLSASLNKKLGNKCYKDKCTDLKDEILLYGSEKIFKNNNNIKIWDGSEYLKFIRDIVKEFLENNSASSTK